jgi:glycosyltransferase involved in cell wall biosynthesis
MDNPVDIIYVTALYDINSKTSVKEITENFLPFLNSSLPIILFTDIKTLSIGTLNPIYLPRSELKSFQEIDVNLPEYRNNEKDTLEFLQLMNAKPEFLFRAKEKKSAKMYVWFDCGILKIVKNTEQFMENMKAIGSSYVESKIVIPGCIPAEDVNFNNLFLAPIWRFCGGVLLVPSSRIELFNKLHAAELEKCVNLKKITWEVNLWAAIEKVNPELFSWYKADHNDTIIPTMQKVSQSSNVKFIFLTMIKNESSVIKRCIESGLSVCDAICICDTGSTDNTIEILEEYLKNISIPSKIYKHTWKNFGKNRSDSFLSCVEFCKELGWNPNTAYAVLLDADMQLKVGPNFNKDSFIKNGYSMMQKCPGLEYYNTRFLKIAYPWKCTGVTHEYWDGDDSGTMKPDEIYIEDIGDGGCKSDKFQRDIRLLEEGLLDEPTNPRYMFYLAQSYKDSGLIDKSIELYTKRVHAGGWFEEVWYSMYTLMKLYSNKNDYPMMEMWGQKAYEYRKERSENLLFLVRHFRDKREYLKAWHYWLLGSVITKPSDILFIEPEAYTNAFEYERLIIHHYVFPEKKHETMDYAIQYTDKYSNEWSYSLIKWFVEKIPTKNHNIVFHDIGDFNATSSSLCKMKDGTYCVNLRYVNYRILPDGNYIMYKDGVPNHGNDVLTENYQCIMDRNFNIVTPLQKMNMLDKPLHNTQIKGLEDVRLFMKDGDIWYTATTLQYSYNGKIRQHMGKYNIHKHTFDNSISLRPPVETYCEKNWIPYKENKFIYKWHPFQIGSIHSETLVIEKAQKTPFFFSNMRGSTPFIEDGEFLYGITHCVIYEKPRKYYHMVVKINKSTDMIVEYTHPFYFLSNAIEYCIGLEKRGSTYYVFVSQNDKNLVFLEFEESSLVWRKL